MKRSSTSSRYYAPSLSLDIGGTLAKLVLFLPTEEIPSNHSLGFLAHSLSAVLISSNSSNPDNTASESDQGHQEQNDNLDRFNLLPDGMKRSRSKSDENNVVHIFKQLLLLSEIGVGVYEKELDMRTPQGTFFFFKFLSSQILQLEQIGLLGLEHLDGVLSTKIATKKQSISKSTNVIYATGGGAHKYGTFLRENFYMKVRKMDELGCLVHALRQTLHRSDGCFALLNAKFGGDKGVEREKLLTMPVNLDTEIVKGGPGVVVVNIGSGVSILHVKYDSYERTGGSSLGGSTFLGLVSLLTGCDNFDDALDLAANGDSTQVDMLVKDIYGEKLSSDDADENEENDFDEDVEDDNKHVREGDNDSDSAKSIEIVKGSKNRSKTANGKKKENMLFNTLRPTTLAASFGKMIDHEARANARKEDLALSTLVMCSMNVAAIAHMHAKQMKVKHIIFTGNFLSTFSGFKSDNGKRSSRSIHLHARDTLSLHKRNTLAMRVLSYAISFWSKQTKNAVFMRHEGCLGALGAMLVGTKMHISDELPSPRI